MICLISERIPQYRCAIDRLIDCGILVYVTGPCQATELCERKDIGGVILDLCAAGARGEALLDELLLRYPEMPIAILSAPEQPRSPRVVVLKTPNDRPEESFDVLLQFCTASCHAQAHAALSTSLLSLFPASAGCRYMGYPLALTPLQYRILHCLLYLYPKVAPSEDLLFWCGLDSKTGPGKLTKQIAAINRRAAKIHPSPLILNRYGVGYILRKDLL